MEIRPILKRDYAAAMILVADFAEESLFEYGTFLDTYQLQKTFDAVFKTSFAATVDEELVGVLGGRIIGDYCCQAPVYDEVIWYMNKQYRRYGIQLLRYVEKWCRDRGIRRMTMACMHNSKTEKLFRLYKRMGFQPMETRFLKQLD